MTRRNLEIQNVMLDYRDKHNMAKAIIELRWALLGVFVLACGGWALAIAKCVV
jgi:hypothetical protein